MGNNNVLNEKLQYLTDLERFMAKHELRVKEDLIKKIKYHYKMLKRTFEEYFKNDYSELLRRRNLFVLRGYFWNPNQF